MKTDEFAIVLVFGFLLGGIVVGTLVALVENKECQKYAVENQCGHYDTNSGNFKWNNQK